MKMKFTFLIAALFHYVKPEELAKNIHPALLCGYGHPLLDDQDKPLTCETSAVDQPCPNDYWCHVGLKPGTTVCCPRNKQGKPRCEVTPVYGYGTDSVTRYWYDWTNNKCVNFTYTGFGGNENNFETLEQCENTCLKQLTTAAPTQRPLANKWEIPTDAPLVNSPSLESSFADQEVMGTHQQSSEYMALPKYEILVPGETLSPLDMRPSNPCAMPADQGGLSNHSKPADRWHWNSEEQKCKRFMYMGRGGNQNHFLTKHQCQDTCGGGLLVVASCDEQQEKGDGFYRIPRWYYDANKRACVSFMYTGYAGSQNRFVTKFDCQMTCIGDPGRIPEPRVPQQPKLPKVNNRVSKQIISTGPSGTFAATSPCRMPTSQPLMQCSTNSDCAQGMFCQHGGTPLQTVCCPALGGSDCTQPRLIGTGSQTLPRWWYNPVSSSCETFMYRGLQGNQNNFQTYDQCESSCQMSSSPCGSTQPYSVNGQYQRCNTVTACPASYYCHIGTGTRDSVCCPVQGNACEMPIAAGVGVAQMQRWGFSTTTKQCVTYIYTGSGGNQNNFLTQSDCISMCQVAVNPCAVGQPYTQTPCSTANPSVCGSQAYCHIGASTETTVCCPKSGSNPCHLPLSTGTGNAVLPRWYFDAVNSQCKAFTYTGQRGNENNFLSLADCRRVCPEYDNPCPAGNPPVNPSTGQVSYCTTTNTACPANHWCHIGHSRQTSVCCPFSSNPCTMPKVGGTGVAQLPRYYYNQLQRQCDVFTYSGKGGNQNNFQSKAQCEAACPVLDNPCAVGMPATLNDGSPQLCTTSAPTCPAGYWCHFGPTSQTTLCCPGAADPCIMPLSRGSGNTVLARWYYNTDTKTCLSFSYTGRGGNQNNFQTLQECRTRCPEYQNPCSTGQPHIGLTGQITHCGATTPTICPTTYWCHIGASLDQSVCCPGAGDPCALAMSLGNGQAQLLRYYYDAQTQTCRQFTYTGMGGNENNFMTLTACEQRCPVFRNPCAAGDPAREPTTQQIVSCSVRNMQSCPATFWCHVGSSEQTTLCCPGAGNACTQPVVVGTGDASLPRYYYSSLTQQCLPFTYSGIGGNQNNYLSRADCERACPVFQNPCAAGEPATGSNGQYTLCSSNSPNVCPAGYWCHIGDPNVNSVCCPGAENPCLLPLQTGTGAAALTRWYFDVNLRRCTQFTYLGTFGNQNNFLSQQDCRLRCPEFGNPCSTGDPAQAPAGGILFCAANAQTCPATYWCHIGHTSDSTVCCPGAGDPCVQPMLPGTGSSKLNRFYFNQNTRQCLPFTYTGVGGNQNNFLSELDCAARCPVFRNPCASAVAPQQVVFCSAQSHQVCPAGYWCHVGTTTESSLCCPGASDPCSLPVAYGMSSGTYGPLRRWYYDARQRLCREFDYLGIMGNQNNFLTREQCQQKCPEFVNPCVNGEPYRDQQSSLVRFCSLNAPGDCPSGYWCHVGATRQATVCCPGQGDPCTIPLGIGAGSGSVARWYFNQQNRRCQQFTYSGLGGNQNNFITQRSCQLSCPEFSNPCSDGSPLTSINGQITYCSAKDPNICPMGYYCHVGLSQESTVCCPGATDPCVLPLAIGRSSASLQRYYFNQLNRRCESFVYSGAGGNANNFLTLQQCRQKCPEFDNPCLGQPYRSVGGQVLYCNSASVCPPNNYCHYGADTTATMCCPATGNPCASPVVIGTGRSQLTRYYYNSVLQQCITFVYSGLGGNENNFRSQAECVAKCRPAMNPCGTARPATDLSGRTIVCGSATGTLSAVCPNNYYCHQGASSRNTVCCPQQSPMTSPCKQPREAGLGSAQVSRWYYNADSRRCQMFTYNGAAGNENNFQTYSGCVNTCVKREDAPLPKSTTKLSQRASFSNSTHNEKHRTGQPLLHYPGVCPQGDALRDARTGRAVRCEFKADTLTPDCSAEHYICNVMVNGDSYCCPDPKNFCLMPRDPGSCGPRQRTGGLSLKTSTANLSTRYGYNPATDSCVPFLFTGCAGNLNNFESLALCTNVCCEKGYNLLSARADAVNEENSKQETQQSESEQRRRSWLQWLQFW